MSHVYRNFVRQQSANLLHLDVIGRLTAAHGIEIGIGHVRVGIDSDEESQVSTGAVERLDKRRLVALLLARSYECKGIVGRTDRYRVVEVEVGTPMAHNHVRRSGFAR